MARDAPTETAAARDELYRRVADEFGPSLGRLAAAYEAEPAHRDDLLQDIHIAVWRSLAGFEQRSSLRTWVYRVAHNTAASHVRRQRRARRAPLVSLDELDEVADSIDREEEVTQSVVLARVREIIHMLKPIDRDVLLLYLEGLEAADIADIVGISRSNVAQKVHRAKASLHRYFSKGAPL